MKPTNEDKVVLLIEDDEPKLKSVVGFLHQILPDARIETAGSLSSAIKIISSADVTFAVIDMSLPTYDTANDRTGGGKPQGFGGVDILRFIASETPETYSVILTQYEEFTEDGDRKDLQSLSVDLHKRFGPRFLDVIYYAGQLGDWRDGLRNALISAGLKVSQ